jgi:hypothetical protein
MSSKLWDRLLSLATFWPSFYCFYPPCRQASFPISYPLSSINSMKVNLSLFSSMCKCTLRIMLLWRNSPHNILKISALKVNLEYIYFQLSVIHTTWRKMNYNMYKSTEMEQYQIHLNLSKTEFSSCSQIKDSLYLITIV